MELAVYPCLKPATPRSLRAGARVGRLQLENEYKSIKNDFLAETSSKDYQVRLFYFVFAVLLHNIWRLTDFLLKAGVGGEIDYAPVLTAGECVELVCSPLLPPD